MAQEEAANCVDVDNNRGNEFGRTTRPSSGDWRSRVSRHSRRGRFFPLKAETGSRLLPSATIHNSREPFSHSRAVKVCKVRTGYELGTSWVRAGHDEGEDGKSFKAPRYLATLQSGSNSRVGSCIRYMAREK